MALEQVAYKGWRRNVRLSNGEIELIVTQDVGPRIIRLGFIGERNILGEISSQIGGHGEKEWLNRGGHRLWLSPEEKPRTYELDNEPVHVEEVTGGIRTSQKAGPISGVEKVMEIRLAPDANNVNVFHKLTNKGNSPVRLAPWALTVVCPNGTAIIPLPAKISHSERLLPNQKWILWGYTDFSDPRWTMGSRYLRLRHDPLRGPTKLGIAHEAGWAAYLVAGVLFVKRFNYAGSGAEYPDGGVNFETFANEDILELESLGPLATLRPGESASHEEKWSLHRNVPACASEAEIDTHILPLAR